MKCVQLLVFLFYILKCYSKINIFMRMFLLYFYLFFYFIVNGSENNCQIGNSFRSVTRRIFSHLKNIIHHSFKNTFICVLTLMYCAQFIYFQDVLSLSLIFSSTRTNSTCKIRRHGFSTGKGRGMFPHEHSWVSHTKQKTFILLKKKEKPADS